MIRFFKGIGIILFVLISFLGKACLADAGNTVVKKDEKNLFVTQHVSSNTLFINEQAIHTILFFRKVKTTNASLEKPELREFKVEDLGIEKEYEKIISGTSYLVTELRYAIFPVAPGTFEIPAVTISCDIIARSNRSSLPFLGSGKKERITITSMPLTIKVIRLPEYGKPSRSSELVGLFSLSGVLNKDKVIVGDSVTLTVTLTGKGNLYELAMPVFPEIIDCRIYQDRPRVKIDRTSKGISGIQTYKMAIIPIKIGLYVIDPVLVRFFDPEARKYREIFTDPLRFEAHPVSSKKTDTGGNALTGSEMATGFKEKRVYSQKRAILGIAIILAAGCAYCFYLRKRKYHKEHTEHDRTENALKRLRKDCKDAASANLEKVHRAFKRYIEDKTGTPALNLTTTEIEALLFEFSVSKELTCKTVEILNNLDTIRFSREKSIRLFKTEIIQNIEQTALELEQELAAQLTIIHKKG
ncbi:MAG: BatD family protein [Thermodesulfobacteriota bacterium]|nr:BatD family protein [Thermodesulfobacteriota bacterium]